MRDFPYSTDLTHVNILSELYMSQGLFDQTYKLISAAEKRLDASNHPSGQGLQGVTSSLPLDLTVKAGVSLSHLSRQSEADLYLSLLLLERPEDGFGDLFLEVASTMASLGKREQALTFFEPLLSLPNLSLPNLNPSPLVVEEEREREDGATISQPSFLPLSPYACNPVNWLRAIDCYRHVGRVDVGLGLFERLVRQMEVNHEASISTMVDDDVRDGGGGVVESEVLEKMMSTLAEVLTGLGRTREAEGWVLKLMTRLGVDEEDKERVGGGEGGAAGASFTLPVPSNQEEVARYTIHLLTTQLSSMSSIEVATS